MMMSFFIDTCGDQDNIEWNLFSSVRHFVYLLLTLDTEETKKCAHLRKMFYRHAYAWYDEIRNPGHVVPRQLPCSVIQPDFMEIVVVGNRDYCFLGVL